jgi:hypothetical protein
MTMRTTLLAFLSSLLSLPAVSANSDYFEPTAIAVDGNAMVYVYRPAATNPGFAKPLRRSYPEIMVDGESAGFLKYNRYLAVEVAPGEHRFLVTGLTRGARWEPRDREYKLKVEPGESYFLRLRVEYDTDKMSLGSFKGQYIINFHPVDGNDAVYEIRHTDKMD